MQSVCVPQIMSKIIDLNKHNEKKSLLAGDKCTKIYKRAVELKLGLPRSNPAAVCCLISHGGLWIASSTHD